MFIDGNKSVERKKKLQEERKGIIAGVKFMKRLKWQYPLHKGVAGLNVGETFYPKL